MLHPIVAIVGAPNVGKSTLFNRILGRRRAIVSDLPGVTRDRNMATCDLHGLAITLVDTGGVIMGETDDLTQRVRAEALKAVEAADLILFVLDARAGLTATEREVASILRRSGKPILVLANKVDAASLEGIEFDFYQLGLGEVLAVSAEQGRGFDELVERIRELVPRTEVAAAPTSVPIAILGRPNVGKSSLFNRIVRKERALVSAAPGTTRDPVEDTFDYAGVTYRIVDTAGIRRRSGRGEDVERISVMKARQAIREAEITIAMIDASEKVGHQDLALLGLLGESRRPAVLAANKVDLLPERGPALERKLEEIRAGVRFSPHVPVVGLSALTGMGVDALMETMDALRQEIHTRFSTAELNRALAAILDEKQPPADRGRPVRFYYLTQVGEAPPRFLVFSNGRRVDATYRRYMEGRLRIRLGLIKAPLALAFRRGHASR